MRQICNVINYPAWAKYPFINTKFQVKKTQDEMNNAIVVYTPSSVWNLAHKQEIAYPVPFVPYVFLKIMLHIVSRITRNYYKSSVKINYLPHSVFRIWIYITQFYWVILVKILLPKLLSLVLTQTKWRYLEFRQKNVTLISTHKWNKILNRKLLLLPTNIYLSR